MSWFFLDYSMTLHHLEVVFSGERVRRKDGVCSQLIGSWII